jgi:predicted RNA-binding Zn-ribbon protein involved in translation (DUF1610 family)
MSSQTRMIPLRCVSCGGKLEITPDMSRFACGYCGAEQFVERRGGTVALKAVTEAISRVQVGTDKTAAELALRRLQEEKEELKREWRKRLSQAEEERKSNNTVGGVIAGTFCLLALLIGSVTVPLVGIIMALAGVILGLFYKVRADRPVDAALQRDIEAIRDRRVKVELRIEKNKEIVDS